MSLCAQTIFWLCITGSCGTFVTFVVCVCIKNDFNMQVRSPTRKASAAYFNAVNVKLQRARHLWSERPPYHQRTYHATPFPFLSRPYAIVASSTQVSIVIDSLHDGI